MLRLWIFLTLFISFLAFSGSGRIEAQVALSPRDYLSTPRDVETKTYFKDILETKKSLIAFETESSDDNNLEYDEEKEQEAGVNGEKSSTFRVTYWQGKEVYRVLDSEKIAKPKNRKVLHGTKIVWRELSTEDEGPLKYWRKMRVWATSYDPNCKGCTGRTYSGTPVVVGTCAVDPKVIVMGSHFYVPGYGLCSALDIGGAIKGQKVDLGFPDVSRGWWSARFTDIYLVDGIPQN